MTTISERIIDFQNRFYSSDPLEKIVGDMEGLFKETMQTDHSVFFFSYDPLRKEYFKEAEDGSMIHISEKKFEDMGSLIFHRKLPLRGVHMPDQTINYGGILITSKNLTEIGKIVSECVPISSDGFYLLGDFQKTAQYDLDKLFNLSVNVITNWYDFLNEQAGGQRTQKELIALNKGLQAGNHDTDVITADIGGSLDTCNALTSWGLDSNDLFLYPVINIFRQEAERLDGLLYKNPKGDDVYVAVKIGTEFSAEEKCVAALQYCENVKKRLSWFTESLKYRLFEDIATNKGDIGGLYRWIRDRNVDIKGIKDVSGVDGLTDDMIWEAIDIGIDYFVKAKFEIEYGKGQFKVGGGVDMTGDAPNTISRLEVFSDWLKKTQKTGEGVIVSEKVADILGDKAYLTHLGSRKSKDIVVRPYGAIGKRVTSPGLDGILPVDRSVIVYSLIPGLEKQVMGLANEFKNVPVCSVGRQHFNFAMHEFESRTIYHVDSAIISTILGLAIHSQLEDNVKVPDVSDIMFACYFYNLGKHIPPDSLMSIDNHLLATGDLTPGERTAFRRMYHRTGAAMLDSIFHMAPVTEAVLWQDLTYDGEGSENIFYTIKMLKEGARKKIIEELKLVEKGENADKNFQHLKQTRSYILADTRKNYVSDLSSAIRYIDSFTWEDINYGDICKEERRRIVDLFHLGKQVTYRSADEERMFTLLKNRLTAAGYHSPVGENLPLEIQIVNAVKYLVSHLSDRAYRERQPIEKVVSYMHEQSGKQFSPIVVDALMRLGYDTVLKTKEKNVCTI
ncbi:MAG: hypothetical protein ABIJ08_05265 [Nanoarchaeota archaeon]